MQTVVSVLLHRRLVAAMQLKKNVPSFLSYFRCFLYVGRMLILSTAGMTSVSEMKSVGEDITDIDLCPSKSLHLSRLRVVFSAFIFNLKKMINKS